MTVAELIAELQKLKPDAPVLLNDNEYGPVLLETVAVLPKHPASVPPDPWTYPAVLLSW